MIKLFVGGFPLDITELELVTKFDPYADVSTIKIVRDKKTGICKGYAFLEIADQESAERAMEALDGTAISGKRLSVKKTDLQQSSKPFSGGKYPKLKTMSGTVDTKRPWKKF